MLQDLDHDSGKIASISPEDPLAPNGAVQWIRSELPSAPSKAVRWNESSGHRDQQGPKDPLPPDGAVPWISSKLPLAPIEAVRWNESSGQQDLNNAKRSQPLAPSLVECGLRGRASITIQPLAPLHFSMQPWSPENSALDVARAEVLPAAATQPAVSTLSPHAWAFTPAQATEEPTVRFDPASTLPVPAEDQVTEPAVSFDPASTPPASAGDRAADLARDAAAVEEPALAPRGEGETRAFEVAQATGEAAVCVDPASTPLVPARDQAAEPALSLIPPPRRLFLSETKPQTSRRMLPRLKSQRWHRRGSRRRGPRGICDQAPLSLSQALQTQTRECASPSTWELLHQFGS